MPCAHLDGGRPVDGSLSDRLPFIRQRRINVEKRDKLPADVKDIRSRIAGRTYNLRVLTLRNPLAQCFLQARRVDHRRPIEQQHDGRRGHVRL